MYKIDEVNIVKTHNWEHLPSKLRSDNRVFYIMFANRTHKRLFGLQC